MSGSSPEGAVRPVRDAGGGTFLLPAFTSLLVIGAVVLYFAPVRQLPAGELPFHVPWVVLAAGFLLAEIAVVHYDFRSEAHSFSLSELPLVFGLFFAAPWELVTAQVVGAGIALLVHRRQTGLKLVFNLAHFALSACLAVLVFRALREAPMVFTSSSWVAALVAAVVSSAMSTLAIFAAISLSERRADLRKLPEQLGLALLATGGAASLALLGAGATARDRWAIVLLAVPIGTFSLAYRAYVRQRQEHDSLEFLYESARILDAAADLPSALTSMLGIACRTFRVELAQFVVLSDSRLSGAALSDAGTALLVSTTADDVRTAEYIDPEAIDDLLQRGMRADQAQLLTFRRHKPARHGLHLREVLVGPIGGNTRTSGALLLGNRLGTASFSAAQLRLFRTLITQINVSLENGRLAQMLGEARKYAERERRNSLELQRGLLPTRLPARDDVAVAVRYQPAGHGAEVGGDWYDVLVLPSGNLGVVIGDVLGHDLRSAARMAQARSALRAYATEGHPPAVVMQRLNWLLAQTDPDFMGTCCYAEVCTDSGEVAYVLAGHPPPLLVPASGESALLVAEPGLPLGVDEHATYASTTVELAPGATLVLYTDGLVESKVTPLLHGLVRLTQVPGVAGHASVEDIADRLLASVPEGETGDDMALVALRMTGVRIPPPRTSESYAAAAPALAQHEGSRDGDIPATSAPAAQLD